MRTDSNHEEHSGKILLEAEEKSTHIPHRNRPAVRSYRLSTGQEAKICFFWVGVGENFTYVCVYGFV